jgi:hypothetical protein
MMSSLIGQLFHGNSPITAPHKSKYLYLLAYAASAIDQRGTNNQSQVHSQPPPPPSSLQSSFSLQSLFFLCVCKAI